MVNSLLGYHSFSIYQKLSAEDNFSLNNDFIGYMRNSNRIKRSPVMNKNGITIGTEYTYKQPTGIRWLIVDMDAGNRFKIYGVKVVITPKVLLEKNYVAIATEKDTEQIKTAFNNEARKISSILGTFDNYSMSRCDYCLNVDLKELSIPCTSTQMMALIKKGNIPIHFTERMVYDITSHRKKSDENSFYLESGSVVVNCYDKHTQLILETNHPCLNKNDADSVIRFEVQCRYPKLYAISKGYKVPSFSMPVTLAHLTAGKLQALYGDIIAESHITIPINALLSHSTSASIINKYFKKIVRAGDYYTLEKAKRIIQSSEYHPKKKARLVDALTITSQCRGIHKVKNILKDKKLIAYKQSLKDLDYLRVNPVTIPRDWNIEYIPNLQNAYYDRVSDMQVEDIN